MNTKFKFYVFIITIIVLAGCEVTSRSADNFFDELTCQTTKIEVVESANKHNASSIRDEGNALSLVFEDRDNFVIYFFPDDKIAGINRLIIYKFLFWSWDGAFYVPLECTTK